MAVGKAEVGHDAGAVVLDDDVAYGNKLLEQGLAAWVGEVQGDAALGAVDFVKACIFVIGALLRLVGGEDGHVADAAAPGEFDLDDLCSEMAKHPSCDGPGYYVRQVQDAYAGEGKDAFCVGAHS